MIADDHPIVREGIRNTIEKNDDLKVMGEASDYKGVYKLLSKESWDLIILDLKMPGINGIEILSEIKTQYPQLPVIILSSFSEELYGVAAIKAGAAAFINKNAAPTELVDAIRRALVGKKYINATLAELLADHVDSTSQTLPHLELSNREFEIMKLIGSGTRISDIAEQLCISVSTANSYRARMLTKMNFKTNADVIQYTITNKLQD